MLYQTPQVAEALPIIRPQLQVAKQLSQVDIRKQAQLLISQAHHRTLRLTARLITTMRLKQL